MDYQEAIENHINECRRRIDFIKNHMNTNAYADKDRCCENIQVMETSISAMQELQQLHDQGLSLERLKDINFRKSVVEHINYDAYASLQGELEEYKQIGTLEEVQEAVEKHKAKKPKNVKTEGYRYTDTYRCPTCGGNFSGTGIADYCYHCGQKLDWGE